MADVPDELAQVAERVAADVYKGWRITANRDAYVDQAIRAAAHQAVSAALAGRAVVDLPEPDGVDETGTWWNHDHGTVIADGLSTAEAARIMRRRAGALLAAANHIVRNTAAGSGAGERP